MKGVITTQEDKRSRSEAIYRNLREGRNTYMTRDRDGVMFTVFGFKTVKRSWNEQCKYHHAKLWVKGCMIYAWQ